MDKGKLVRLLLIPIIIGLVVTLIIRQMLSAPAGTVAAGDDVETAQVVVIQSKQPVPLRTKLTEAHLAVKQVPRSILTGNEYSEIKDVVGTVTMVEFSPGEVILKNRVVAEGKGSLPYRIPTGYRAITIRIDELTGVAGHPAPGDLVDLILFLSEKQPNRAAATTRIIHEGVQVLGMGPAVETPTGESAVANGGPGPRLTSVTLALTPDQAVDVALAEQIGLIKLMLRPALKEGDAGRILKSETQWK